MTEAAEALDPQMPHEPFEQAELPGQPDPRDIARAVAMDVADEPEQVGDVVNAIELGDNVTDFRLAADVRGYEGWQWSVTLYHDAEVGTWTVNESSLVPTDDALVPPAWVPWKDRLEPTDLAPTDSIGTDPDDPRLEGGFRKTEPVAGATAGEDGTSAETAEQAEKSTETAEQAESAEPVAEKTQDSAENAESADSSESAESTEATESTETAETQETAVTEATEETAEAAKAEAQAQQTDEIVEEFALSRRHVLSPKGRAQVAKRWYEGPRGPKALSTKTADGNLCSTCGFFVPLKGELNLMFGVCANKWSPDDGRVVSVDHGCGEHSEIEPPEPSHLWVQSKPAYDDFHIDVIAQKPRDERGAVEAIEQLDDDSQDSDEATEEDILANTEPDTGDDEPNETQPAGVEASAELEAVIAVGEGDGDSGENEGEESAEAEESAETAESAEGAEGEVSAEPTGPVETEETAETGEPCDAEESVKPEEPEESVASAESGESGDAGESEESAEAAEAVDQSTESAEPAEAAEDAEPAEAAEPAEPAEAAEPDEPGESDKLNK
ncbi:hypothetical protein BIFANG_02094 [Bifidobacterium angulatum DSM 20098 = JCM 7096]|uniref:DUF3027 domain-containing protein n=2 Tax=Bifidobacterium angulatum TaxID=1683 RepID=C4FCR8_9BIFI|nr:DUF3027 domain-containing protein [Bifidobacterium angulatum]EEP21976.1 hypothetical protein BIFANG_02094 [Bifidobacterium angulatum DSM 20098 = JCM 7096]BAQ97066.1 conserved hypothetical protein [Bifidobacterium angulatum DSM 20098 = JCM 7096]